MHAEIEQALETLRQNRLDGLDRALALLQNTVFSFSMRVCGHRQDAEDIMQETLLQAVPKLQHFDNSKALGVWLYKVAKTRCLMSRRRSKFAPRETLSLEELMPDRKELPRLAGSDPATSGSSLVGREARERLQQAVLKLPPAYRLVLVLHDMEDLSSEQVARVLGLSQGTVRVRLHRARVFVRNQLAKSAALTHRLPTRGPASSRRCKRFFPGLSDYLNGTLDDALCDELKKHLASCPSCEAFLKTLKSTVEQCRRHPPARLERRVAARRRRALRAAYRRTLALPKKAGQEPGFREEKTPRASGQ